MVFIKRHTPWNKGLKGRQKHHNIEGLKLGYGWNKGIPQSKEAKEKNRIAHIGKPAWNKGMKMSQEFKQKVSLGHKGQKSWNKGKIGVSGGAHKGELHHNWKGGITPLNKQRRRDIKVRLWRKAVFERDDYTCVNCKQKGGYLQADHIKPWSLYPKLRQKLPNGRTLCLNCHRLIGWKGNHKSTVATLV